MHTIMTDIGDTDGLDYAQTIELFFGDITPWHETRAAAEAEKAALQATGEWPEGRPRYWIEQGEHEIPWEKNCEAQR